MVSKGEVHGTNTEGGKICLGLTVICYFLSLFSQLVLPVVTAVLTVPGATSTPYRD